jgi:predicted enzyme related to lactoylglutathione lyase
MDMCYDVSMPTMIHFEYPQMMLKGERNSKFYRDLFGWKIEKWSGTNK